MGAIFGDSFPLDFPTGILDNLELDKKSDLFRIKKCRFVHALTKKKFTIKHNFLYYFMEQKKTDPSSLF